MKQTFTLLVLLILSVTARSQTYIPFPSSNAMWTERHGNGEAPPSFWAYSLMNGDTVLGTTNYHKLYRAIDPGFTAWSFYGGLREDGLKRVYFNNLSSERLLYDFAVTPGDTVDMYPGPGGTVSYIDSVYVSGQYHKRINFNTMTGTPWLAGSWIEGIGNSSLGGLLYSPMAQPTCDCANNLICFKKDGTWLYHNPAYASTDCEGPVGLPSESVSTSVSLFPNPVTDVSYIHISSNNKFNKCIVYNVNGSAVLSYDVVNNSDIRIEKSKLPAGIYCYRLSGEAGAGVIEKFIVQ